MSAQSWRITPLDKKSHNRAAFDCGIDSLNSYLRERASQDVRKRMTRIYAAAAPDSSDVAGYCSLSATGFEPAELPADAVRGLPPYAPYPALLLGRLAVDLKFQSQGLGRHLLMHTFRNVLSVSETAGVYALTVKAWDNEAVKFYQGHGFHVFIGSPEQLFLPVKDIQQIITAAASV